MKKILLAILVLALSLVGFACTGTDGQDSSTSSNGGEIVNPNNPDLVNAISIIKVTYQDKAPETPSSYKLMGAVSVGTVKFDIVWTVEGEGAADAIEIFKDEENGNTVIKVGAVTANLPYVLVATITDDKGESVSARFDRVIPKLERSTWEQYADAKDGTLLWTEGTITGLISKSHGNKNNCIHYGDNDGGYYAFGGKEDPIADLHLAIGMKIKVLGEKDIYNGTFEIKNYTVEVLSNEINELPAVDLTEVFTNAKDLDDKALTSKQGALVTLKGVEISDITGDKNDYHNFTLAGKKTYVRISGSTCALSQADKEAFVAFHKSHLGCKVDVTGIVNLYDGKFYLTPVKAETYTNVQVPEKTPEEQVAFEKNGLYVPDTFVEDGVVDLPLVGGLYKDVKITWESSSANAVVDGVKGTLTLTLPALPETFTLTATLTHGAVVETKAFNITLSKLSTPEAIVDAAYALKKGESLPVELTLTGIVTKINYAYSDKYKNATITIAIKGMGDKQIKCYKLVGTGLETVAVGDTVTITGILTNYNDNIQFAEGCTLDAVKTAASIIDEASKLGENKTLGEYALTGEVTKVNYKYNPDYKNVTVTVKFGTLEMECYKLAGPGADVINVGDTVTVFGTIKRFVKNGDRPVDKIEFDKCVIVALERALSNYSDQEKVDAEAGKLEVASEIKVKTTLTLAANGSKFEDVVITWTVNGTAVTGTYDVVPGEAAQTLTIVAKVACGEVVFEKTFTVAVAQKLNVQFNNYKFTAKDGSVHYMTANLSSGKLKTTTNAAEALSFVMEETEVKGEFRLYFFDETGAKKYFEIKDDSKGISIVDTPAANAVFVYDADNHLVQKDCKRAFCLYDNDKTIRSYKINSTNIVGEIVAVA